MLVFQSLQGLRLGGTDRRAAALFFFSLFLKKRLFSSPGPSITIPTTLVHHVHRSAPHRDEPA